MGLFSKVVLGAIRRDGLTFKSPLALELAWYNFGLHHGKLRVTHAMDAGLTDHSLDNCIAFDMNLVDWFFEGNRYWILILCALALFWFAA